MQVMQRTVTIMQGDASGKMQQVIKESVSQRIFTYQEMLLLASSSKFRIHQAYGDLLTNVPIDDPDAARMVLVLQPE